MRFFTFEVLRTSRFATWLHLGAPARRAALENESCAAWNRSVPFCRYGGPQQNQLLPRQPQRATAKTWSCSSPLYYDAQYKEHDSDTDNPEENAPSLVL